VPPAADLRGSAGPPRVTHILTDRKIKLRRPAVGRKYSIKGRQRFRSRFFVIRVPQLQNIDLRKI
jgi:hypothetical protein